MLTFDLAPFVATILDAPLDYARLRPLADYLMDRDDPRGEMLSLWEPLTVKARRVRYKAATIPQRDEAVKAIPPPLHRWAACLLARYTPVSRKRIGSWQTDPRSRAAITIAMLHGCGLVDDDRLSAARASASKVAAWASALASASAWASKVAAASKAAWAAWASAAIASAWAAKAASAWSALASVDVEAAWAAKVKAAKVKAAEAEASGWHVAVTELLGGPTPFAVRLREVAESVSDA